MFSRPKERFVDQQFIECWQMSLPDTHSSRCAEIATQAAAADKANTQETVAAGCTALIVIAPTLPDDKAAYLVNPEANERL